MVLPDKLLRVGLALGMHLPSNGQSVAQRDVALGSGAMGAFAGSTDLVRFHSTLKIARGIVEEQKRAEMMEVPREGLVSILDRIKDLEDEVLALMNGNKQALSAGGKSSAAAPTGDAAGGNPSSGASTAIAAAGGSNSGAATADAAGGNAGGQETGGSAAQPTAGSQSSAGSDGGSGTNGGEEAKSKPSKSADAQPSNGAIFSEKGSEDDCAPEKLLYHLGGGSLQKRDNSVSGHPLFRRNANCTLDNVTGSKKVSQDDSSRPNVTPAGSAAAENQETSNADNTGDKAAPAAGTQGTSNTENASGDEPLPTAVDVDGKTLSVETVAASQLADDAEDPPPAVVTDGDSSNKSPSPSAGGVFKEEEYTTVVVTSTKDRTTTMTMTKTKTRTIHLKSSPRPDSANAKFADNSQPASVAAEASTAATAPSTQATDAAGKAASSGGDKSKDTDASKANTADKKETGKTKVSNDAVSSAAVKSGKQETSKPQASADATSSVAAAKPESTAASHSEASDSAMELTTTPAKETPATPDAKTSQIKSASAATSKAMSVDQEQKFNNETVQTSPQVAEHSTILSTLLEDPTTSKSLPAMTPAPMSKTVKQKFTAFFNGTTRDTRSSGFKTIPTTREELPITEAQQ